MATSGAADILGMGDRVGRIAAGYEADLAIFDADPLADLGAVARVRGVLNNGGLFLAQQLKEKAAE